MASASASALLPLALLLRESTDPAIFTAAVWGRVFNQRRDLSRVPFAVCNARTASDVVAAVKLAQANNYRVSVRSGGHSWASWSVRQDAVLIDLGDLDLPPIEEDEASSPEGPVGGLGGGGRGRIDYDERTKVVSCPPSMTGRTLNTFLSGVDGGRMFAGGHCPDVGLGGFLLQGGMGWNCKNWGWACESIISIEVVTADAQHVHCSATENADLFWAARGAGPGFPGIATRFHLLTRPLQQLYQSIYIFPISECKSVLQTVIDVAPTADLDTEMVVVTSFTPPDSPVPTVLANFTSFKPSLQAARAALTPLDAALLAKHPNPLTRSVCHDTSLEREYASQTAANPANHRYRNDNVYIPNSASPDIPSLLEEAFTSLPTRQSCALWFAMNPTSRRELPDMALSMQSDHYVALYSVCADAADDERCSKWVSGSMAALERHSVGSYLGDADFQVRRTKFWSDEAGERLKLVRKEWDPHGRICGFLDEGDGSGVEGLMNEFEWLERGVVG
ncbi:FAD binding domain protein [Podospora didyma]|uniref:FAD binding domain protein n=1 Tax=Podospora didyma TaxID=330526 RepID=A0AAE0P7V5_9PEZI|nr:FAD binding domain protein [Podospora didyma]